LAIRVDFFGSGFGSNFWNRPELGDPTRRDQSRYQVFVECYCFFCLYRACFLETMFSLLNYIMFWKLPFSYISCMQYFDWTNGAPLDWSLLASNTTRGGPGASLTGPPAKLVYAH